MFQLESFEYEKIKIQTNVRAENSSSQTVMIGNLPQNRTNKYLPLENLIDEKSEQQKWDDRKKRILIKIESILQKKSSSISTDDDF